MPAGKCAQELIVQISGIKTLFVVLPARSAAVCWYELGQIQRLKKRKTKR